VEDHVHLAIQFSRMITIAALVEELKRASSKWAKTQDPALLDFAWQRGYGVFSVSPANYEALLAYIDNQEEHHRKRTFQEEYRAFLAEYRVAFYERYVWE
jgi:REP element-mobilizing transposase RayT